jgi:acetate kinase
MVASLEGLDTLVFTAGIGENSPLVWEHACKSFSFLGLKIDPSMHRSANDQVISAEDSEVTVLVIHTQEEWAIAQECMTVLQPA